VVGTFPDGNSALMLVCARLRHVASKAWGTKTLYEHDPLGRDAKRSSQFYCRLTACYQAAN